MAIVSTIISLAHDLRLEVIAEGVDAEDQAMHLRRLGCDQIQGDLLSKPITAAQIGDVLRALRPGPQ
jgi:EAL domain-containing protein (putative c-di-GMP-specific phosphodiesterase class I)